uniref:Uncharacterized protein n=1 Tax=Desertifilum tharense IPPAS B-1220 TaxID=1781255 RepID=A0ACD5H2H5_9CYAN
MGKVAIACSRHTLKTQHFLSYSALSTLHSALFSPIPPPSFLLLIPNSLLLEVVKNGFVADVGGMGWMSLRRAKIE